MANEQNEIMENKKTNVANATIILMFGAALAKVLGFARELIVAYQFGASNISDAFLLTNSIPNLLFGSIATVVGISYIPVCQSFRDKNEIDGFTSNLLNITLLIVIIGCAIVVLFPQFFLRIIAGGLNPEAKQYAVTMLRIVVFSIIPIIVSNLFQAYSQANGQFHTTAWFGIITNVVIIGTTIIANDRSFYLLSIGVVLANTIGMIMTIAGMRSLKFKYEFVVRFSDSNIKKIVLITIPLLIENLAYSMSLLVDRSLASYLDSGTISGLSYAGTIGNIAVTMIAGSIITAAYPTMSNLAQNDRGSLDEHLLSYSRGIVFLLCPISFFMVFFARDITTIVFNHGAFKETSLVVVWQSLVCYAVGVVPAGLQTYFIRCFYAFKNTKTPVFIQVLALFLNITLNLLSVKYLKHMGIALSTSVSYLIALIFLAILLKRKHNVSCVKMIIINAIKGLICALIAGASVFFIINYINISLVIAKIALELCLFSIVYLVLAFVLQKESFSAILSIVKKKLF